MGVFNRVRILIADDEAGLIKALATFLQREDRELFFAGDGNEAVCLLEEHPVEIVLTDLVMPEVDGLGVLRKALEINPEVIVILMTGYGSIDTAVRAMREGAFDYKAKPFLLDEIGFSIQRAESHLQLRGEKDRIEQERDQLYQRLVRVQEEFEKYQSKASSIRETEAPQHPNPLFVMRNQLDPLEASSSYRQWEPESTMDDERVLLKRLRDEGAISPEQYHRLRVILEKGREMTW